MVLEGLKLFLKWEYLVFAIILVVGSVAVFKYGKLKKLFQESREEAETRINRFNYVLFLFLISFLTLMLCQISWDIIQRLDYSLKLTICIILLIALFIIFLIYMVNSDKIALELFFLGGFGTIVYFLSKNPDNWIGGVLTVLLGILFITMPFAIKKDWKQKNLYPLITIMIMLFVFLSGLLIIDNLYGNQNSEIELFLNINGNVQDRYFDDGVIKCSNPYTDIYVNSTINCKIIPESQVKYAKVILISTIGDKEIKDINNMSFVLPYEISKIMFELNLTKDNETYHVTTANDYKNIFTSYQDALKRDSNFMAYLIALIGLVFISIPPMVEKFRDIIKNR